MQLNLMQSEKRRQSTQNLSGDLRQMDDVATDAKDVCEAHEVYPQDSHNNEAQGAIGMVIPYIYYLPPLGPSAWPKNLACHIFNTYIS